MCFCGVGRRGASRPTSRPATPRRMTISASRWGCQATRWWSGVTARTAAPRGWAARPTRAPPMPGRRMCFCGAGRRGANKPTSRPAKLRRVTFSDGPWRSRATRWWSGLPEKTAARRGLTARPTRVPVFPGRRTCSCGAGRRGASRPTSRPAKSRRVTRLVTPWRCRATRWWSGLLAMTAVRRV